jgi:oligopeptide/dipeptide ABC transporter ATP-binding protein
MTSLNPVVRIGRQLTEPMREHLGMGRVAARAEAMELLEAVGIADPEHRFQAYPHQLSGGMRQRVAIAIALACKPALLIADEPTTALDVTVQAQILALLSSIQSERQMAMIFVSHDLGVISGLADEVAVMYAGRVVEQGSTGAVIHSARMPYTQALMRSIPHLDHPSGTRLPAIPGRPPSLLGEFVGCPFAPRCEWSRHRCTEARPDLGGSDAHRYACWYPLDETTAARGMAAAEEREGHNVKGEWQ